MSQPTALELEHIERMESYRSAARSINEQANTLQAHTLHASALYYQDAKQPDNLLYWQDENSGIAALLQAATDIIEGRTVKFALCAREGTATPTIVEIVTLAMGKGGDPAEGSQPSAPRYCGEDDDPNGPGSHALIASWYDYCADPAAIAVAMALAFKRRAPHFFRLR